MSMGISEISSSNSVPPSAWRNRPSRSACAPVKAPFTEPNSSLSISSRGRAAQLILMILPLLRGLKAWMRSAITSLPVPLSPVMSTATSLGAMRSMVRTTSRMTALWKIGEAVPLMVSSARRKMLVSSICRRRSMRVIHIGQQLLDIELGGFADKVERAALGRLDRPRNRLFVARRSGQDDDLGIRPALLDTRQQVRGRCRRQLNVQQHQIGLFLCKRFFQRRLTVGLGDEIAIFECVPEQPSEVRQVIYN